MEYLAALQIRTILFYNNLIIEEFFSFCENLEMFGGRYEVIDHYQRLATIKE